MTHKLILKVQKFQLSSAKRLGAVEEKPPGGWIPPPSQYHFGLTLQIPRTEFIIRRKSYRDNALSRRIKMGQALYMGMTQRFS